MIGTGDYDNGQTPVEKEAKTIDRWCYDKQLASDPDNCASVIAAVLEQLEAFQWENRDVFGIHMAVEEAVMNAICHGNKSDPGKVVHIVMEICGNRFYAKITDQGEGFNPESIPDPTLDENLEKTSGRGVMLMKSFIDNVTYNDVGNSVEMEKSKSS